MRARQADCGLSVKVASVVETIRVRFRVGRCGGDPDPNGCKCGGDLIVTTFWLTHLFELIDSNSHGIDI